MPVMQLLTFGALFFSDKKPEEKNIIVYYTGRNENFAGKRLGFRIPKDWKIGLLKTNEGPHF